MTEVVLRPIESIVVLNQGDQYLEGYLLRKPLQEYGRIEQELQATRNQLQRLGNNVPSDQLVGVPWDKTLARGMILKEMRVFVDVLLIDYGIRECCSKKNVYLLPEKFKNKPGYGIRVDLPDRIESCLRDTTVTVTSLVRRNAISASGSLAQGLPGADPEADPEADSETGSEQDPGTQQTSPHEVSHREINSLGTALEILREPAKTPDDLLLHMIGTRCFLVQLLVMQIESPIDMLCSHYGSRIAVTNALDSLNELPSRVPHDKVSLKMLVLVCKKACLHRGIVRAIFTKPALSYQVEFIDEPGSVEARLLYRCPSQVANAAPRALIRLKSQRPVRNIEAGDIVTLLCCRIVDSTAYGDLIQSNRLRALKSEAMKSKL